MHNVVLLTCIGRAVLLNFCLTSEQIMAKISHVKSLTILATAKTKWCIVVENKLKLFPLNNGYIFLLQETSGSAFSIIVVIARLSSGALFMSIQEFYPEDE